MTQLQSAKLAELKTGLKGELVAPGDAGYDEARTIWNAMIDRRPGADRALRRRRRRRPRRELRARQRLLVLAVRGGGHNIAGNAVCDGGLMIDLSRDEVGARRSRRRGAPRSSPAPRSPTSTAETQALRAGHAARHQLDHRRRRPHAGRRLRLAQPQVRPDHRQPESAPTSSPPTASVLRASASENPDLFWALRGGGGNFGVVTSFEFRLHPVGPRGAVRAHRLSVRAGRSGAATTTATSPQQAPDELTVWVVLRKAPPLPFLPAEVHGKEVVVLAVCYAATRSRASSCVAAAARASARRSASTSASSRTPAGSRPSIRCSTPGARNYWKSHDFTTLDDGAVRRTVIDAIAHAADAAVRDLHRPASAARPTAVQRRIATAYAAPRRAVRDERARALGRAGRRRARASPGRATSSRRSAPYATGGVYVNFMTDDEGDRVRAAPTAPNYARLAEREAAATTRTTCSA